MAYVIAVVGAGGKTTYIYNKAKEYIKLGKTVAITTTTKMWLTDDAKNINDIHVGTSDQNVGADFIRPNECLQSPIVVGNKDDEHLLPLTKQDYESLCNSFDVVLVEADGSKMMPLKIPNNTKEPVVPSNANEIVVVYGLQSIGRKLGVVCHRFDEYKELLKTDIDNNIDYNTIVDVDLIKKLYTKYYEKPLLDKYKNAKISLYLSDMTDNDNYKQYKNIALCILASGFSKRFGQNKLFYRINDKELYKIVVDEVIKTKNRLIDKLKDKYHYNINIDISIISQYDEILNDIDYKERIITIKNANPDLGQSESIKLATKKFYDCDAICFLNCDTPYIDCNEISNMLYYYICSNKHMGAVATSYMPQNPAVFDKKYFDDILKINGDIGPKDILNKNIKDCYIYHIDKHIIKDIDTIEDISNN